MSDKSKKTDEDLTRIEDISEFIHTDDPEIEAALQEDEEDDQEVNFQITQDSTTQSSLNFNDDDPQEMDGMDGMDGKEEYKEENEEESHEFNFEQQTEITNEYNNTEMTGSHFNLPLEELKNNEDEKEDEIETEVKNFQEDLVPVDPHQESITEMTSFEEEEEEEEKQDNEVSNESLNEVKNFVQNLNMASTANANPPFSLLLKNLKYKEDKDFIIQSLKDIGLINQENLDEYERGLEIGNLLISQISEYVAITLVHKFKNLDVEINMGHSEEIHPPKHYQTHDQRGLVDKSNVNQNKAEKNEKMLHPNLNDIILSTTGQIYGKEITDYIGIISEHQIVSENDLQATQNQHTDEQIIEEIYSFEKTYEDLANKLKEKAIKKGSNAVIGINYNVQTLTKRDQDNKNLFRVTCTGSLVVVH